jgi:hypothetical protein
MIAHITVWTLAWDTREGTNCKVFATEKELDSYVERIMREDVSATTGEDVDVIRELLEAGGVWEAWEKWCETCKDPLDTYNWDSQPLDVVVG